MNRFADYMESRHMLPLYEQAAAAISTDIPRAIRYCESRAVNHNLSRIYNAIAQKLHSMSEVDYGKAFANATAQIQARRDAEEGDAAHQKASDILAADRERRRKEAEDIARAGRKYPYAPADLVGMLKHVGEQLRLMHSSGHISHDYTQAIQGMIMDLNAAITHSNRPTDSTELANHRKQVSSRQTTAAQEMEKKAASSKQHGDLIQIVKTLRQYGLHPDVSDAHAASAYEKIFAALKAVHAAGGKVSSALRLWSSRGLVGGEHASDEESQVMDALINYSRNPGAVLPVPGVHKHQEPEPEPPESDYDHGADTNDDWNEDPLPPPVDDDDWGKDIDSERDEIMPPDTEPDEKPKRGKKKKNEHKIFDLSKLDGLVIKPGEEHNALITALNEATVNFKPLESVQDSLRKLFTYIMKVFNEAKQEKGVISKSVVTTQLNRMWNGKGNNPTFTDPLVREVVNGLEGSVLEELKSVVQQICHRIYSVKRKPEVFDEKPEPGQASMDTTANRENRKLHGDVLQENEKHSMMLQVLAGIKR